MNRSILAWILCLLNAVGMPAISDEWGAIQPLPDREGFAGSYAGVSHNALLVAGGANFPDKGPADGGSKVWYDQVFALENRDEKWHTVGRLPRPLGYGVSVSHPLGVICAGGSDASQHYADVFRLEWLAGKLQSTSLPSLPHPIANAAGTLVDNVLFIVGGQATPFADEALRTVWQLDLSSPSPQWQPLPDLPGQGRIFAVVASFRGKLWVAGGAALTRSPEGKPLRAYLVDAYCFDQINQWQRIADLPRPVTAAASPAPTDDHGFFVLGGDDGTQVGIDPSDHRGFSHQILHYDYRTNRWAEAGRIPAPRVTVPCVKWQGVWVLPSGERLPGVRSPQVWTWTGDPGHE